mmetsp:Transcript_29497/g.67685  ORF Transcript_29497/g.67685 Transcript_29497/m.67685 type:complete len:107 (+) Transcript_29497:1-321(+)
MLWSGVPILTLPGDNFAQRVASGMVKAAGLPWMVARNLDDYRALALALMKRPKKLAAITATLREGREAAPLFDTALLTNDYQRALLMSWDVNEVHGAPFHIVVAGG